VALPRTVSWGIIAGSPAVADVAVMQAIHKVKQVATQKRDGRFISILQPVEKSSYYKIP